LENGHIFEKIIIAGWGKTRHDQEMLTEANGVYVPTPQLQKLNQNYVNTNDCMRISPYSWYYRRLSTETLLCAQGIIGTSDSCEVDSGGPLMEITSSNHVEIIGIVSHGSLKCDSSRPAIHTLVSKFMPWITELINGAP
jgi:secreted trypsin-like serine protease